MSAETDDPDRAWFGGVRRAKTVGVGGLSQGRSTAASERSCDNAQHRGSAASYPSLACSSPEAVQTTGTVAVQSNSVSRTALPLAGEGWGLGFERTLAYVTGLAKVRDAIPFPRTPRNARY